MQLLPLPCEGREAIFDGPSVEIMHILRKYKKEVE